jgi:uncharacterized phage protein (TIGR01671 family)
MREIKFRGKKHVDNQWIYGTYMNNTSIREIFIFDNDNCGYCVRKETIGQYTGLKDKNGVEIYEGDIIRSYANYGYGKRKKKVEIISEVIFYLSDGVTTGGNPTNEIPRFTTRQLNKQDYTNVDWSMFFQCEVIGNIYEGEK